MSSLKSVFDTTVAWAEQRQIALATFDEIGSTNDEAKTEAAVLGDDAKLYLAAHQTHGRGRGKNTWLDTGAGESLLSSWSFHIRQPPQAITGPLIGKALFRSVETVWASLDWSIKPPNDLYLGDHKMAGLLVESVSQGDEHRLVIGLGMNILNHPRAITNATHFTGSGGDANVAEGEWYQFLDVLFGQFRIALADVVLPHLSLDTRSTLLKALNAFPLKKEPYLEVSPNGDLSTKSGSVPWMVQ